MAKFIYDEGDYGYITLRADRGEEISIEVAQAWAAIHRATALNRIADAITGLDDTLNSRLDNIADKMIPFLEPDRSQ